MLKRTIELSPELKQAVMIMAYRYVYSSKIHKQLHTMDNVSSSFSIRLSRGMDSLKWALDDKSHILLLYFSYFRIICSSGISLPQILPPFLKEMCFNRCIPPKTTTQTYRSRQSTHLSQNWLERSPVVLSSVNW